MGNSIIDGLKSRLMQYLTTTLTARWFVSEKHVVEDDVLFTKQTRYTNTCTNCSVFQAYNILNVQNYVIKEKFLALPVVVIFNRIGTTYIEHFHIL